MLLGGYEVPPDIGRGAERVLQGCLDRSVTTRWTIAKVDEVAWGIGWGNAGDHATPTDSDDELESLPDVMSSSRSRSRPPEISIPESPDWQSAEQWSRSSVEAASRRSSSRLKRSLSRAPMLTNRSPSVRHMLGRSNSQQSRPQSPSVSTLNTSVRPNLIRSPSSSRNSLYDNSALLISPSASIERGRRLKKTDLHYPSRSPSPSIVPTTPSDIIARSPAFRQALRVRSEDLERSSSRGRQKYSQRLPKPHSELCFPLDTSELDVLEETADWIANETSTSYPPTGLSSTGPFSARNTKDESFMRQRLDRSRSKLRFAQSDSQTRRKRPGSVPPMTVLFSPSINGKGTRMFTTPLHTPNFSDTPPATAMSSLDRFTRSIRRSRSHEFLRLRHHDLPTMG